MEEDQQEWWRWPCILGPEAAGRRVWKEAHGDPGKLWVLHRCGRRKCWQIKHLYLGTVSDNAKDTIRHGTFLSPMVWPEVIAKVTKTLAGKPRKPLSPETKAKIAASLTGRHHTEEAKEKMSTSHTGVPTGPKSAEHRQKLSAVHIGRVRGPMSLEHKAKISAALRKKVTDGR